MGTGHLSELNVTVYRKLISVKGDADGGLHTWLCMILWFLGSSDPTLRSPCRCCFHWSNMNLASGLYAKAQSPQWDDVAIGSYALPELVQDKNNFLEIQKHES